MRRLASSASKWKEPNGIGRRGCRRPTFSLEGFQKAQRFGCPAGVAAVGLAKKRKNSLSGDSSIRVSFELIPAS
jgi:hypothetical protein